MSASKIPKRENFKHIKEVLNLKLTVGSKMSLLFKATPDPEAAVLRAAALMFNV